MRLKKEICSRTLLGILLAVVFLVSYLGAFSMGMRMNTDGTMSGCSIPGMATLCHMDPLEHIALWQSMFAATQNQNDILATLLMLLALAAVLVRLYEKRAPPELSASSSSFAYYKQHIPIAKTLQEAFSRGILNSKIYQH